MRNSLHFIWYRSSATSGYDAKGNFVDVPVAIPFTTPVPEPTVATVVLLLAHIPAGVASLNVVVVAPQIVAVPVITAGNGFTVSGAVSGATAANFISNSYGACRNAGNAIPELEPMVATEVLLVRSSYHR